MLITFCYYFLINLPHLVPFSRERRQNTKFHQIITFPLSSFLISHFLPSSHRSLFNNFLFSTYSSYQIRLIRLGVPGILFATKVKSKIQGLPLNQNICLSFSLLSHFHPFSPSFNCSRFPNFLFSLFASYYQISLIRLGVPDILFATKVKSKI